MVLYLWIFVLLYSIIGLVTGPDLLSLKGTELWTYLETNDLSEHFTITVEPGYNDIGLSDTSSITSRVLWYQFVPHC